jgi:hypothetical protein
MSLPQVLSPAQMQAAYSFFQRTGRHRRRAGAHIEQTFLRMGQLPVVLAIQDTTELNLTYFPTTNNWVAVRAAMNAAS